MANTFNPQVPKEQDPLFFHWSKPIPQPEFKVGTPPPSGAPSMNILADVLETGAKESVGLAGEVISDITREKVQPIVNEQIRSLNQIRQDVTGQSLPSSILPPPEDVPKGVREGLDRVKTLQSAKANGTISLTNYTGELYDTTSTLRQRFPAFKNLIDSESEKITQQSGANKLIASMVSDINSFLSQKDKLQEQVTSKLMQHLDRDGVAEMVQDIHDGKRSPMDGMKLLNGVLRDKTQLQDLELSLRVGKMSRENQAEVGARLIGTFAAQKTTDLMSAVASKAGIDLDATGAMDAASKKTIPPDEAFQRRQDIEQMVLKAKAEARAKAFQPMIDENGNTLIDPITKKPQSWASYVGDQAKVNKAIDDEFYPLEQFAKYLTDDKYGPAMIQGLMAKAIKEKSHLDILRDQDMGEITKFLAGIEQAVGSQAAAVLYPGLVTDFNAAYGAYTTRKKAGAAAGQSSVEGVPPSIKEDVETMAKDMQAKGVTNPSAVQRLIRYVEGVANPSLDPTIRRNLANYLYDEKNKGLIALLEKESVNPNTGESTKGQYSIYSRLASPEMLTAAKELGVWDKARDWTLSTFNGEIIKPAMVDLNRINAMQMPTVAGVKGGIELTWDDQNLRWDYNMGNIRNLATKDLKEVPMSAEARLIATQLSPQINNLNKAIQSVATVYKLDGKDKVEQNAAVLDAMIFMGFDPTVGNLKGIPEQFLQALKNRTIQKKLEQQQLEEKYKK